MSLATLIVVNHNCAMNRSNHPSQLLALAAIFLLIGGCRNDADTVGVAAQCDVTDDCPEYANADGDKIQLDCLTQFAGGYCGIADCADTLECPDGSICVAHIDGTNYCFRSCVDKSECNANRSPDTEANCSANFDWAVPAEDDGSKACIPPSSGI